jgi:tellurite methyltransferase
MSQRDKEKWNDRYRERRTGAAEPSSLVIGIEPLLPARGRALDVAGGAGRHAIWLARRGLDVTLIDVSDVGLARARERARAAGVDLITREVDLETAPLPPGPWDVIVVFHFLSRPLFPALAAALAPGGLLVFCQPTRRNLERHRRPSAAYLLDEGELPALIAGLDLEVISCEEGWLDEGRHEARLVARRAGS